MITKHYLNEPMGELGIWLLRKTKFVSCIDKFVSYTLNNTLYNCYTRIAAFKQL